VEVVRRTLSLPDEELDYAEAKLAFDRAVDPSIDADAVLAELDSMAAAARDLAGPSPDGNAKLNALRKLIYQSGPWNGHRPFSYDHGGFKALQCKLLSNYLETRLGNCVSMPVLFLILADRIGLNVALSMAPRHLFVRYRDGAGPWINLEATGTALPARDEWYRQTLPMSDRSVASGFYLRTLGKREGVAALATSVLEHLSAQRRWEELVEACGEVLRHYPGDGNTWARLGHACYTLLWHEYLNKYPSPYLIPPHLGPRFARLSRGDREGFRAATALGWEPPPEMTGFYDRFEGYPEAGHDNPSRRNSRCS